MRKITGIGSGSSETSIYHFLFIVSFALGHRDSEVNPVYTIHEDLDEYMINLGFAVHFTSNRGKQRIVVLTLYFLQTGMRTYWRYPFLFLGSLQERRNSLRNYFGGLKLIESFNTDITSFSHVLGLINTFFYLSKELLNCKNCHLCSDISEMPANSILDLTKYHFLLLCMCVLHYQHVILP